MTEKTSITQFLSQLNRSTFALVIKWRFSQLSVNKKIYFVFPVVTTGFVWLYLQDDGFLVVILGFVGFNRGDEALLLNKNLPQNW